MVEAQPKNVYIIKPVNGDDEQLRTVNCQEHQDLEVSDLEKITSESEEEGEIQKFPP